MHTKHAEKNQSKMKKHKLLIYIYTRAHARVYFNEN